MAPRDENDPSSPLDPKPIEKLLRYAPGFSDITDPKNYQTKDGKNLASKNKKSQKPTPFLELDNGNIIEFGHGSFEQPIDSSDVGPSNWKQMARMIESVYDDYDAFVILHGTDTMAFTSSALAFMFENLGKPVIITGSQLPISYTRTDAVLNFVNAIYVAGYKATDLPKISEVVIVFAHRIIRGCRASKVSTTDWAGFDSPNFPLLGTIGEHIVIQPNYLRPAPQEGKKFFVNPDLDEQVFDIRIFPGFVDKPKQMEKVFLDDESTKEKDKTKGMVIYTFGAGNAPGEQAFLDIIGKATHKQGKLIVNITQCGIGQVEMGLYEASNGLLERGVLSGMDMTPEAALTKLMWTLGTQFGEGQRLQMQINQRGEQTENLFDLQFGNVDENQATNIYKNAVHPDGRLDRDRISRAMLRISNLGIKGAKAGDNVKINVFMNMPNANHETPDSDDRCVGSIQFNADEKTLTEPQTRMQNITYKTENVIGRGDVILTLVTENPDIKIYFSGLYIAVYATA